MGAYILAHDLGTSGNKASLFTAEGELIGSEVYAYGVCYFNGTWDYVKREMESIVSACREKGAICKVIFENCYLEKDEIRSLALIAKEVGPDFIKTSTGFGTGGAAAEDVRLMKETAGERVRVKAAGGIRIRIDFCPESLLYSLYGKPFGSHLR